MMNGIELAARFSYITNSLHFCGPSEANKEFLEYFKGLSHISSKQNPNLQKINIIVAGKKKKEYVCTRCLKAGKVKKAL